MVLILGLRFMLHFFHELSGTLAAENVTLYLLGFPSTREQRQYSLKTKQYENGFDSHKDSHDVVGKKARFRKRACALMLQSIAMEKGSVSTRACILVHHIITLPTTGLACVLQRFCCIYGLVCTEIVSKAFSSGCGTIWKRWLKTKGKCIHLVLVLSNLYTYSF